MGSSLTLAAAATLLVLGVTKMQVAEGGDVEEEGVRVIAGGAKMEDKEEGDGEDEEDVRVKLQEFLQNDESLQKIELLIGWRIRCMQRKLANVYRAVYPHIYCLINMTKAVLVLVSILVSLKSLQLIWKIGSCLANKRRELRSDLPPPMTKC